MEELSYVLTKNFVACVPVRFYFFHTAHFHLAGRWHFLFSRRCYEIFMFFFQGNSSPLFSITRSSSFSVINVSVNIKNIVENDSIFTLVCLWCGRTSGRVASHAGVFRGARISSLSDEIRAPLTTPAWEASGRADVRSRDNQNFLGCIDNEIVLPMVLRARENSAISEVGAAHWFNLIKS